MAPMLYVFDMPTSIIKVNKPVIQSYGMKQLCVNDPDGFSLCFQCAVG